LGFIVWLGFSDRGDATVISAFDGHALAMVMLGSTAAVADQLEQHHRPAHACCACASSSPACG